jgi:hypothetical protein
MTEKSLRSKNFRERYAPRIPFNPYLTHPLGRPARISEGYIYTQDERTIHGNFFHKGIDFESEHGARVYASAAGYAVAGYHRFPIRRSDGSIRTYKGKPLANGFGLFVQIFHPPDVSKVKDGRITQYGHLSMISDAITFKPSEPKKIDIISQIRTINEQKRENALPDQKLQNLIKKNKRILDTYPWTRTLYGFSFSDDFLTSESYTWTMKELKDLVAHGSPWVRWVKQGQEIGKTGSSAVFYGDVPYVENSSSDPIKPFKNTWDEAHLHFEEAARDPDTRKKKDQRDPFDIYKSRRWYTPKSIKRSLFVQVPVE